jgi:hypothetical protein
MRMLKVLTGLSAAAVLVGCGPTSERELEPATVPAPTRAAVTLTAQAPWETLLSATPFAYERPLPDAAAGALDGTYAKVDLSPPQWWLCYRCADYRPAGGIWRLQFDRGVMRIYYELTGWKTIASYSVSGNKLEIFNDAICPHDVGEYGWSVEDGQLVLTTIADACAFDLRKENLGKEGWISCSREPLPDGCVDPPDAPSPASASPGAPIVVEVSGGDSRFFSVPPEVLVAGNPEEHAWVDGIEPRFAQDSIPYGTDRVLWWKGDWMEASTELPFSSMGVQFWGSGYLGWARILFDGEEVWRGLTSALGRHNAIYGGYVEISGFELGAHTIRVENLGFDYHPVKIAGFGFGHSPVVK